MFIFISYCISGGYFSCNFLEKMKQIIVFIVSVSLFVSSNSIPSPSPSGTQSPSPGPRSTISSQSSIQINSGIKFDESFITNKLDEFETIAKRSIFDLPLNDQLIFSHSIDDSLKPYFKELKELASDIRKNILSISLDLKLITNNFENLSGRFARTSSKRFLKPLTEGVDKIKETVDSLKRSINIASEWIVKRIVFVSKHQLKKQMETIRADLVVEELYLESLVRTLEQEVKRNTLLSEDGVSTKEIAQNMDDIEKAIIDTIIPTIDTVLRRIETIINPNIIDCIFSIFPCFDWD